MRKLLFVFVLGAFAACGNGSSKATTNSTSVTTDTSTTTSGSSGAMSSNTSKTSSDSELRALLTNTINVTAGYNLEIRKAGLPLLCS